MEEVPLGINFVDLGPDCTCCNCDKRYCKCKARQTGYWECNLPVKRYSKENKSRDRRPGTRKRTKG